MYDFCPGNCDYWFQVLGHCTRHGPFHPEDNKSHSRDYPTTWRYNSYQYICWRLNLVIAYLPLLYPPTTCTPYTSCTLHNCIHTCAHLCAQTLVPVWAFFVREHRARNCDFFSLLGWTSNDKEIPGVSEHSNSAESTAQPSFCSLGLWSCLLFPACEFRPQFCCSSTAWFSTSCSTFLSICNVQPLPRLVTNKWKKQMWFSHLKPTNKNKPLRQYLLYSYTLVNNKDVCRKQAVSNFIELQTS